MDKNYNPHPGSSPAYLSGYSDGFYMTITEPESGSSPAYVTGFEDGAFDATHGGPF